jgi:UDP-N-acetylglucosamine 2-epimerase
MKLLFVLGTRPEAIKLAPVIWQLAGRQGFECRVCATGQHRELLSDCLELFELRPDWSLNVMRPEQHLAHLTGAVLSGVSAVLEVWPPDRVIVQGDTVSAFAGALAAFYHRVPVGHVEAGLRTGDIYAPWPEEVNRRLVAGIADLHFAPTPRARAALLREGVAEERISVTGNTGIDALFWISGRLDTQAELRARTRAKLGEDFAHESEGKRLILITGHRRESFDGGLERVAAAIGRIALRPDITIVFPIHPNPNVRRAFRPLSGRRNILLVEPVSYPELVYLLRCCHFVVTDSGGIQEEAPSFGKPVLVTRETTERPEAIELGLAQLVGTDEQRLYKAMCALLDDPEAYRGMSRVTNPFGDGKAAGRIADRLTVEQTHLAATLSVDKSGPTGKRGKSAFSFPVAGSAIIEVGPRGP